MKIYLITILGVALAWGENQSVLSEEGKNRLEKNLQTLNQNSVDAQHNLEVSKNNALILQAEERELEILKKEHLALDKRYLNILTNTSKEIEKNDKALKELVIFEEKSKKIPIASRVPNYQQQLDSARLDKENRQKWKKEALDKQAQLVKNREQLQRNLHSIEARKNALRSQSKNWNEKQESYSQILNQIQVRQKAAEKLTNQSSNN